MSLGPNPPSTQTAIELEQPELPELHPSFLSQLRTSQPFTVRSLFDSESDTIRWSEDMRRPRCSLRLRIEWHDSFGTPPATTDGSHMQP